MLGICLGSGNALSHNIILAKAMERPYVVVGMQDCLKQTRSRRRCWTPRAGIAKAQPLGTQRTGGCRSVLFDLHHSVVRPMLWLHISVPAWPRLTVRRARIAWRSMSVNVNSGAPGWIAFLATAGRAVRQQIFNWMWWPWPIVPRAHHLSVQIVARPRSKAPAGPITSSIDPEAARRNAAPACRKWCLTSSGISLSRAGAGRDQFRTPARLLKRRTKNEPRLAVP